MAAAAAMLAGSPRPGQRTTRDRAASDDVARKAQYTLIPSDDPDGIRPTIRTSNSRRMSSKGSGTRVAAWRLRCMGILDSIYFQIAMATLIILNAVLIGLETDFPNYTNWDVIEHAFLACFALELSFKMAVVGPQEYFQGTDTVWNVFDFLIVSLGILDLCGGFIGTPSGGSATLFRVIRLLRILRIFRIVRFLKELYLLAVGFVEAAKAVIWVTILMAFMLYVCSVLLARTLGNLDPSMDHAAFFHEHFGSVLLSMWSLFELMASPNLPEYTLQKNLLNEHPLFAIFLVMFVIFGSFGMIALLTGVISESMFQKNQVKLEADRLEQERMHNELIERCSDEFDTLGRGFETELPREVVDCLLPTLRRMLDSCGVDYTDQELQTMISLMDFENEGKITKKQFASGISRIIRGLRPVPIQEIAFEVFQCKKGIEAMSRDLQVMRRVIARSETDAQVTPAVQNESAQVHLRTWETASREQMAVITDVNMRVEEMHRDLCKQLQELRASSMWRTQAAPVQFQGGWDIMGNRSSETSMSVQVQGLVARSFTVPDLPPVCLDEPPEKLSCSLISAPARRGSASPRFGRSVPRKESGAARARPTLLAEGTDSTQEGSDVASAARRMPQVDHGPDRCLVGTTSSGEVRVHHCPTDPRAEEPPVTRALQSPKREVEGLGCASPPLLLHEISMMSSRAAEPSMLPNISTSIEPEEAVPERYSQSGLVAICKGSSPEPDQ